VGGPRRAPACLRLHKPCLRINEPRRTATSTSSTTSA
jgi:hypothetical protein